MRNLPTGRRFPAVAVVILCAFPCAAQSVDVGRFPQQVREASIPTSGLESQSVACLSVLEGAPFAGTATGLYQLRGDRWGPVPGTRDEPMRALTIVENRLVFVSDRRVGEFRDGQVREITQLAPGVPVSEVVRGVAAGSQRVYIMTDAGVYGVGDGRIEREPIFKGQPAPTPSLRYEDISAAGERVAVATSAGAYLRSSGSWQRLQPHSPPRGWLATDARAVAFSDDGSLWLAVASGVARLRDDVWTLFDATDGLPYAEFTSAATARDGSVWFGTRIGAVRWTEAAWEYRQGRRWLPADVVRDVIEGQGGDVWFLTSAGVSAIRSRSMTLAEKAEYFEQAIDTHHRRTPYGFVDSVYLQRPGDRSSWQHRDSDNDGLWTSMYGASQCYAWAVTKDPRAKQRARRAFEALRFLGSVTQGGSNPAPPGFVARTVLPTDGPDPNEGRLERDRQFRRERDRAWKLITPRWPRSADGKWYWKCDTSSDELDGHFYFYPLYYDLVAETEAAKAEVRRVVSAIMDHLMAHDFDFVDHDGEATRWGHFGPTDLNFKPLWWVERGLNSLSVLSYLNVAHHVSGDRKYREAAERLINEHGYAINALYPKYHVGPGTGNQSDDEMAFMSFYNLVRFESNPELARLYAFSFWRYWELERAELNPFFNFLYAAVGSGKTFSDAWGTRDLTPKGAWLDESVDTLKRFPLDRANWGLKNSHRLDVTTVRAPGEPGSEGGRGHRQDGRVLPIDERFVEHWNHDPWRLDYGGDGRVLADGASFLLPYYLGRYHGVIE